MQIPSSTFSSNSHKNKQQSSRTYQRPIELTDIQKNTIHVSVKYQHHPTPQLPLPETNKQLAPENGWSWNKIVSSFPFGEWPGLFSGAKLLLLVSGNFHVNATSKALS